MNEADAEDSELDLLEKVLTKIVSICEVVIPTRRRASNQEEFVFLVDYGAESRNAGHVDAPIMRLETADHIEDTSAGIDDDMKQLLDNRVLNVFEVPPDQQRNLAFHLMANTRSCRRWVRKQALSEKLVNFIAAIQSRYLNNPFHNFSHGLDVLAEARLYLHSIKSYTLLSEVTVFWFLIAALGHDVGHLGVNNQFLVETSHVLALRYNDKSVLENMHCKLVFEVLSEARNNVLEVLDKADYKTARSGIVEVILGTDMVRHSEDVKAMSIVYAMHQEVFESAQEDPSQLSHALQEDNKSRLKVLSSLLHTADISNPMKPWAICQHLADLCLEEFFAQGDKEKELGIPVQMLNDRDKVNRPNSQVGFIEFVIAPLAEQMAIIFPGLSFLPANLSTNTQNWAEIWKQTSSASTEELVKFDVRISKVTGRFKAFNQRREVNVRQYKHVFVKPPDDEDRVEALKMAADFKCTACEVLLQSLLQRAESLTEDHIMDQFDGELEETVELTDNPQDRSVFGVFLGGPGAGSLPESEPVASESDGRCNGVVLDQAGVAPNVTEVAGLGLPRRTALAAVVLHLRDLPLFRSWRCHARRLATPFVAVSGQRAAFAGLCQDRQPGELVAFAGEAPPLPRTRSWLLIRLLQALPKWNVFYLALDAVWLQPLSGRWNTESDVVVVGRWHRACKPRRIGALASPMLPSKILSAVWLRPVPDVLALLEEVVNMMNSSSLLGLGSLAEESVVFHKVLQRDLAIGKVKISYVVGAVTSYEQFTGRSQVRQLLAAGHWLCAETEFADVAGTWDMFYHNGFRTTYSVSQKGEVRATRADGSGVGHLQAVEAGRFSHKLLGIHRPGTWERFRLESPGRLHLQHWEQETLVSIAKGFRKRHPLLPGCGCPEDHVWCVPSVSCSAPSACSPQKEEACISASVEAAETGLNRKDARVRHLLRVSAMSGWQAKQVPIGVGGGFSSKLQMAVGRAVKAMRFGKHPEFVGHLGRYTNNSECLAFLGEVQFRHSGWACLFKALPRAFRRWSRTAAQKSRLRMLSAGAVQAAAWQPSRLIWSFFDRFRPDAF
ncbi:PDE9A [Symbiodinium natans]|uniref:Phosphodiesterase n=1 Tax=Symbiodinium natans TaxID=878477 RepID=A0A812KHQ8_9DINO|nr:PDE9A [Symbiodinium natans]